MPTIAKGEREVRRLATRGFALAQHAGSSLADCAALLVAFDRATADHGAELVRAWVTEEAEVWAMVKRTCAWCGGPGPCQPMMP